MATAERVATAPASFYCIHGGNDLYWRVNGPAKALGAKTFLVPEEAHPTRDERGRFNGRAPGGVYAVTTPNTDSALPWEFLVDRNDPDYWEIRFPLHEGAAVWTRPDLLRATLAKAMREKLGIRTIAEVDDNYLGDPKLNLFMKATWSEQATVDHLKAHGAMSALVTSTGWLRDRYAKALRKTFRLGRSELPELYVCRNNVAAEDWPVRVERDGPVRVGWMGSPSHVWDVNLMWAAMLHARNIGCEPWIVGYDPVHPWGTLDVNPGLMSAKSRFNIEQWRKVGARTLPWVSPERYRRRPLPFDIGLAPLRTDEFTLGKSDVKAIEYVINGAAPILQNNSVYSRDWVHGETCLLVGGPQEMLQAVDRLARDENLRGRIVANAQQYVREERGADVLREEWGYAING